MRNFIMILFCWIARIALSLRYRIRVKGKHLLSKKNLNKKGGVLFLPNHPAQIDPILLTLILWPKFKTHPLAVEYMYRLPLVHVLMKLIGALSIPNLETSLNELKLKRVNEVFDIIATGLKNKQNFLLYPSARLKHSGKEILGGASGTYHILKEAPDTNVVLIRTVGLWGSSFSRAIEKKSPNFLRQIFSGCKRILFNGIFFMPRRRVTIEIMPAPEELSTDVTRLEFNRYLEQWYNQYPFEGKIVGVEPMKLVPYYFWSKKLPQVKEINLDKAFDPADAHPYTPVEKEIVDEIAKLSHFQAHEIQPKMELATDLGLDSLDLTEVISFLTVHYDVEEIHPEDVETIQDLFDIVDGKKKAKQTKQEGRHYTWPEEEKRKPPELPIGKTIPEAFFNICDRMKKAYACADDMMGPLTYERLKLTAILLAKEIQKMPNKHIGVLLPASVGAYVVTLAILLADKIPVMLNWTLGSRFLDHMVKVTDTKVVISSWKFMEKLTNVQFGSLTDKILLMEDLKKKISTYKKVKALVLSKKKAKSLLKHFSLQDKDENEPAVVLFTSGTEAEPKGVPLSHKNILTNQRSSMQCIDLTQKDRMYGVLPPFHSFGFSVTGLFPILCGMGVVFYPDPTDSYALAEGVGRWKITMICLAPSFLKGVLFAAKNNELQTVRLFVTGAEKTPQELFEKVRNLQNGSHLIEGYGITECAPIISLNRPNLPKKGVGQVLPQIQVKMVDPETHKPVPKGHEGEICVHGPNIFSGYLASDKDPFITIDSKKWYCTGDLGYIDEKGYLTLSGRLKRFTKIGGEMVSLGGLEEELIKYVSEKLSHQPDGPLLAVLADEKESGKTKLILVSTVEVDKQEINEMLKNSGFSRLIKIAQVKQIDEIPLMGTGKVDYRYLQSWIE